MLPTPSVALTNHSSLQSELAGREPAVFRQCSGPQLLLELAGTLWKMNVLKQTASE